MKVARNLILGSGSRILSFGTNIIIGIFLMPFIIHSFGDRIYGYWALVAIFIDYYGLFDIGIVSAVQYIIAKSIGEKNKEKADQAISLSLLVFSGIGIIIFLITIIFALFTNIIIDNPNEAILFRKVLLIMGIGFAIGFPCRIFAGVISANLKFALISFTDIASLLLRAGLTVILIKNGYGIVELASITVFTDLIKYGIYYFIVKKLRYNFRLSLKLYNTEIFKEVIVYGISRFLIKIGDRLRFSIQPFVVSGLISIEAVTHYSVASKLSFYFMNLMIALISVLEPFFSILSGKKDNANMKQALIWGTKVSIPIATVICVCFMFYGKPLIELWMGKAYLDAYVPLIILLIGIFSDVAQIPSISYLNGTAKLRFLGFITLTEGTLILLSNLFLAQKYGLIGIALGTAIPMVIMKFFVQPRYVCSNIGIPLSYYYFKIVVPAIMIPSAALLLAWHLIFDNIAINHTYQLITLLLSHGAIGLVAAYIFIFDNQMKQKFVVALLDFIKVGKIISPNSKD